jgi:hypothetical protein
LVIPSFAARLPSLTTPPPRKDGKPNPVETMELLSTLLPLLVEMMVIRSPTKR